MHPLSRPRLGPWNPRRSSSRLHDHYYYCCQCGDGPQNIELCPYCVNQGKLADAEKMYQRALEGYEKAWGPNHTSTLDTVNNLGSLYANQGKLADAEEMSCGHSGCYSCAHDGLPYRLSTTIPPIPQSPTSRSRHILPFARKSQGDSGGFGEVFKIGLNAQHQSLHRGVHYDDPDLDNELGTDTNVERRLIYIESVDIWSLGCVLSSSTACVFMSSYYDAASARRGLVFDPSRQPWASAVQGHQSVHWTWYRPDRDTSWFLDSLRALDFLQDGKSTSASSPFNRLVTSILTDTGPITLVSASGLYILAFLAYWRQRKQDKHKLKFTIGAGIVGFMLGYVLEKPVQGIVVDLLPWCILCGLVMSSTYHFLVRKMPERNRVTEKESMMVDSGQPWNIDRQRILVPETSYPKFRHESFPRAPPASITSDPCEKDAEKAKFPAVVGMAPLD